MTIGELVTREALKHQVPFDIIIAMICQESGGDRWAVRYEQAFFSRYIASKDRGSLLGFIPRETKCTLMTEKFLRANSFGLMQIMGETAREIGFKGPLLSLTVPSINVALGCQYFAAKLKQHGGDVDKALLSWNGGGNKKYPFMVRKWVGSNFFTDVINTQMQEGL